MAGRGAPPQAGGPSPPTPPRAGGLEKAGPPPGRHRPPPQGGRRGARALGGREGPGKEPERRGGRGEAQRPPRPLPQVAVGRRRLVRRESHIKLGGPGLDQQVIAFELLRQRLPALPRLVSPP